MPRRIQQLLFAPECWACGQALGRGRDFCFSCRREILGALEKHGCLLRYEGAVKGLISCLRGTAPRLAADWCLHLLRKKGQIERWREQQFRSLALAPQNPRREEKGLEVVGRALAKQLNIPLIQPFTKINRHKQHGRSVTERMDTACFVHLRFAAPGKILLLDDVDTTGTTLEQCAYLLRLGGASEVQPFSLARQMMPSFERKHAEAGEESEEMNPLLFHFFV